MYASPETFSNTSLLFPLKDFMRLLTHHILHSLPYWLLKVALNTMPRPPSSSFMGCWQAGKPQLAIPMLAEPPTSPFPAKMMKHLFCLVPLNMTSLLNKAGSIENCHKLLFQKCLFLFEIKTDYNWTQTPNPPLYCTASACVVCLSVCRP